MLKGENKDIDIVSSGAYEFVDSVKAGSSDKEVVVTTTQPVYPLDDLFAGFIHPAVNTPAIFNDGFTGEHAPGVDGRPVQGGPVRLAAKTVTLVPNDKWWGEQAGPGKGDLPPAGDQRRDRRLQERRNRRHVRQHASLTKYKQLDGTKNSEVRRGQRLFAGGLNLNAQKAPLTDVAVRKAIFTAVDRAPSAQSASTA